MLSFEVVREGAAIQIYCDPEGMAKLLAALAQLVGDPSHLHLWAPSLGGTALSDTTPFGTAAVPEVIIDFLADYPDAADQRQ